MIFRGPEDLQNLGPAISENNNEKKKHMKTITKFIYAALAAVTLAIGAVTANGALNDLFASVNGAANNGGGFIYEYTPAGVQSIFAPGLSRPRGMAFDHFGNLFVVTNTFDSASGTFQPSIVKITPDGVQSTFATISGDFFGSGLAIDGSGNVFVMAVDDTSPTGAATIYKFTPDGGQSTFGSVEGQGFGLVFDSAGNLFAADAFDQTIYKFASDGTRSVFVGPDGFPPDHGPAGLAFDRFGNLFVSSGDIVLKFTPDGMGSTFATDLDNARGLAFDRAGNLFVAEIIQTGPGDILKFTPNGVGTVFASGIGPGGNGGPEYLAVQLLPTPRARPTPHPRP
jgi:sugar lactone lactonase YvrE